MKRKIISVLLTAIILVSVTVISKLCMISSADETESDDILQTIEEIAFEGAQIRTTQNQGLRFIFKIPRAVSENCTEFGSVVMPRKFLGTNELEIGYSITSDGKEYAAKKVPAVKLFSEDEEFIYYTVCITKIKQSNYTEEYVAVPYFTYEKNGETIITYGKETSDVSVFSVAELMYSGKNLSFNDEKYVYQNILNIVDPKKYPELQKYEPGWSNIYKP
jgi:hypothetical protein